MSYEIEKGVGAPPKRLPRKRSYPYDQMEVGDSFFVPRKNHNQLSSMCHNARKIGITLSLRRDVVKDIPGIRVFRVS